MKHLICRKCFIYYNFLILKPNPQKKNSLFPAWIIYPDWRNPVWRLSPLIRGPNLAPKSQEKSLPSYRVTISPRQKPSPVLINRCRAGLSKEMTPIRGHIFRARAHTGSTNSFGLANFVTSPKRGPANLFPFGWLLTCKNTTQAGAGKWCVDIGRKGLPRSNLKTNEWKSYSSSVWTGWWFEEKKYYHTALEVWIDEWTSSSKTRQTRRSSVISWILALARVWQSFCANPAELSLLRLNVN